MTRRLAAILAADIVGYSALMAEDEAGTLEALRRLRREVFHPAVAGHRGKIVKAMGDGWLVEFASAVDAVNCAVQVQARPDTDARIRIRMGVHVGDITHEDEDIYGDGVNVAARLEALAEPGAIMISDAVYAMLDTTLTLGFDDRGERSLKNLPRPVRVWARKARFKAVEPVKRTAVQDGRQIDREMIVQPITTGDGRTEVVDLAAGLTSELAQYLSGSRWLAARVAEQPPAQAYVLSGRVRTSGDRVRLDVTLAGLQGETLWSDKYDGDLGGIFDWQDTTAAAVASRCFALTNVNEARWLDALPEEKRTAGTWLRSVLIGTTSDPATVAAKLAACRHAMALDPGWVPPYVAALLIIDGARRFGISLGSEGPEPDQSAWFSKMVSLPAPARTNTRAGLALARHLRYPDLNTFRSEMEAILREEPNSYGALAMCALVFGREGDPQRAIDAGRRAMRYTAESPEGSGFAASMSIACLRLCRDAEALEHARKAQELNPPFPYGLHCAAAALQLTGQHDEARAVVERLLALAPEASVTRFAGSTPGDGIDRVLDALRLAGLPEGAT